MGSAASIQTPKLTSGLLKDKKRTKRQVDITSMVNADNAIFIIVYYNKNIFLNDLKSSFEGITTIPDFFNVEGRTWIPIDCIDHNIAIEKFNVFLRTWNHVMERTIAVGYYDRANRCPCFRDWLDSDKLNDSFVEVDIRQNALFGHVVPQRIDHHLKPFIVGMVPLALSLENLIWAVYCLV
jgi:hypothetical protein